MIGVDTNVLVRYFVNDDRTQARRARRLFEQTAQAGDTVFVSVVTLVELVWVVESAYGFSRDEVEDLINDLLDHGLFSVQHREAVVEALGAFTSGAADFSDYLSAVFSAQQAGSELHTFDRKCREKHLFSKV